MAIELNYTRSATSINASITGLSINYSPGYPTLTITANGVTKYVSYLYPSQGATSSATFSGLNPGTGYTVSWRVVSGGGTEKTGSQYIYTLNYPTPPTPYNLRISSGGYSGNITLSASWSSGGSSQGFSHYYWTIRQNSSYGPILYSGTTTNTSYSISGLSENTEYVFTVSAVNSSGQASNYAWSSLVTGDYTSPVISSLSATSTGTITARWSAYDNHSGIRSSSPYYVSISGPNNTSYGNSTYTSNSYYTFSTDANGNEFVKDARYTVRLWAYDNAGNTSERTTTVTFVPQRPSNWAWHSQKVRGNSFLLTATEWNSLQTRINDFRRYKGLGRYNFTSAYAGKQVSAIMFNQIISALNVPYLDVPSYYILPSMVSSGKPITASDLNAIVSYMNAIP